MTPVSDAHRLLIVGSYTEPYGSFRAIGEGLSLVAMRPDGTLELVDRLPDLPNPAYIRVDPARDLCYTALETDNNRAEVAVVAADRRACRLRVLQTTGPAGAILCHLDLHPADGWIAGACYGSGHVFTRRLGANGFLAENDASILQRTGRSINPDRQTTAHPHAARFSPDGRWLIVPDLGTDEVAVHAFDPATGRLATPRLFRRPAGSGPRMVLFSPDGRHLVLVHELSCMVSSFAWHDGELTEVASHPALFAPFGGENTSAGLRWHPSGRSFAVSNRGADRIALFHFDASTGALAPACEISSGGAKPRDFEFSPCGKWLIVANQDGDRLSVLAVDADALRVRETGASLALRTPSCVRVVSEAIR